MESDQLREALTEVVGEDEIEQWMQTPNPRFEGQTPNEMIESGETDRLWRMVGEIQSNVAN